MIGCALHNKFEYTLWPWRNTYLYSSDKIMTRQLFRLSQQQQQPFNYYYFTLLSIMVKTIIWLLSETNDFGFNVFRNWSLGWSILSITIHRRMSSIGIIVVSFKLRKLVILISSTRQWAFDVWWKGYQVYRPLCMPVGSFVNPNANYIGLINLVTHTHTYIYHAIHFKYSMQSWYTEHDLCM